MKKSVKFLVCDFCGEKNPEFKIRISKPGDKSFKFKYRDVCSKCENEFFPNDFSPQIDISSDGLLPVVPDNQPEQEVKE